MTELNPKKAKEILDSWNNPGPPDRGSPFYREALGFLAGVEWERKRAEGLVKALECFLYDTVSGKDGSGNPYDFPTMGTVKQARKALAAYKAGIEGDL